MAGRRALGVASACLLLLAACSSDPKPHPAASGTASTTKSATASSPTASPTLTPTPSPTPSSSAPLSPFEADPAVVALRAWAAQVAKDFNAGQTFTDPALLALETSFFAGTITAQFADDTAAGLHYPGPLPFQPTGVAAASPTERVVSACVIGQGFAVNAAGQASPLQVQAVDFHLQLVGGAWKVATSPDGSIPCTNVTVATQKW